jgi:hypothetical protein
MAYGHAERNLALIHRLEAQATNLLGSLKQTDSERSAWLQEVISPGKQAVHQRRPEAEKVSRSSS